MTSSFRHLFARIASPLLFVARLLMAFIFVHEAIFVTMNFAAAAAGMAKLGVPEPLLVTTLLLQLGAGLALVFGLLTRPAAGSLALFCISTAVLFHNDFAVRDELLHFQKDLGMAGGLLVLVVRGAGAWSLDAILVRFGGVFGVRPATTNGG